MARVRVWELATGKEIFSATEAFGLTRLAFSRDGKRLASGRCTDGSAQDGRMGMGREAGRVVVWDCETGKELFASGENPVEVALSADGRRVAAIFQQDRAVHPPVGPPRKRAAAARRAFGKAGVQRAVARRAFGEAGIVCPGSQSLGCGHPQGTGRRSRCRASSHIPDVQPGRRPLRRSPVQSQLQSQFRSNTPPLPAQLRVWDVAGKVALDDPKVSRPLLASNSARTVPAWLFRPSATSGYPARQNYELKLYNAADGKESRVIFAPAPVRNATFSPDGKLLAGAPGPNVQVCDTTGMEPQTLKGHTALVTGVAFSAHGSRLVSVDTTGVVKVWANPLHGATTELDKLAPYSSPDGSFRLSYFERRPRRRGLRNRRPSRGGQRHQGVRQHWQTLARLPGTCLRNNHRNQIQPRQSPCCLPRWGWENSGVGSGHRQDTLEPGLRGGDL